MRNSSPRRLPAALSTHSPRPEVASRLQVGPLVLLAVALGLAGWGQLHLMERPDPSANGVVLYLLAILAFSLAVARVNSFGTGPGSGEDIGARGRDTPKLTADGMQPSATLAARPPAWRLIALGSVVILTAYLLALLRIDPPLPEYAGAFALWVGAIGVYLMAVAPPSRLAPRRWGIRRKLDRASALTLGIIVVAAFGLRVWQLETIPGTLGGDEGSQGFEAIRMIRGELRNPFTTGWTSVPTMSFLFTVPSIGLFGNTAFSLRLPWALVGALTVLIVFRLVTRLAGLTLGLMTAALLATYHYHIHFSRLGSNQVADPFFVALALLFLYRAYDDGHPRDWALCGVAVGLAQYAYTGTRFTAIIVAFLVLSFLVRDGLPFWRAQRRGILILLGAALVTAAPMIQYAIRFPDDYNARLNQIGIIQSGWLKREQVVRNQGALPILLDQFQRAALAFNAYPDRTVWYGSPQPLFDFPSGVLFLLGLGYASLRLNDRRRLPLLAWWWGAMILGGVLTESPPSSQRLVTLAPPAVFFVALALQRSGQVVQRAWRVRALQRLVPHLGVVVLALSLASVKWYFVDFTPLRLYGGRNAMVATAFGNYAKDRLGPDWRVYFFGPPRMYYGFGTIPYLAPDIEGVDITEPLTAPPDPGLAQPGKHAAFLFLPERRPELDLVRQTFPDGALDEIPSPLNDGLLFTVYRVAQAPAH